MKKKTIIDLGNDIVIELGTDMSPRMKNNAPRCAYCGMTDGIHKGTCFLIRKYT